MLSATRVSDLPRGLQPREKLQKQGERALSNSELMAIADGFQELAEGFFFFRKIGAEFLFRLFQAAKVLP